MSMPEILLSSIEHDANVRPWELMAKERGLARTVRLLEETLR